MKKLLLALALLVTLAIASCVRETQPVNHDDDLDDVEQVDSVNLVTGVAIDGAMNSVFLKVGDDTLQFSYPDLDSEHRDSWAINDTVTIRYCVTESGDSVTDVILGRVG